MLSLRTYYLISLFPLLWLQVKAADFETVSRENPIIPNPSNNDEKEFNEERSKLDIPGLTADQKELAKRQFEFYIRQRNTLKAAISGILPILQQYGLTTAVNFLKFALNESNELKSIAAIQGYKELNESINNGNGPNGPPGGSAGLGSPTWPAVLTIPNSGLYSPSSNNFNTGYKPIQTNDPFRDLCLRLLKKIDRIAESFSDDDDNDWLSWFA